MANSYYTTALICLNGHIATTSLETVPEVYSPFCRTCGKETMSNCAHCGAAIRGDFVSIYNHHPIRPKYRIPNNCHNCGEQFPWVGLKTQSAKKIIESMQELTPQEKVEFKELLSNLFTETESTPMAAVKANTLLSKVHPSIVDIFKQVVIGLIVDTIKDIVFK